MHGHMYVSMQTHIATCTQKHSTLYTTHRHTNIHIYRTIYKNTHIWTICGLFGSDFNLAVGHTYVRSFVSHPNLKLMLHSRKI